MCNFMVHSEAAGDWTKLTLHSVTIGVCGIQFPPAARGNAESVGPYEQRIEGLKLDFVKGMTESKLRTITAPDQWPAHVCYDFCS